jgi:hypothetical protein
MVRLVLSKVKTSGGDGNVYGSSNEPSNKTNREGIQDRTNSRRFQNSKFNCTSVHNSVVLDGAPSWYATNNVLGFNSSILT